MKLFKGGVILFIGLFLMATGYVEQAEAQNRREAVQAFNKGIDLASEGKYDQAVSAYMQVIEISDQIGEDAQDIKEKAESKIPQVYLQKAISAYKDYQKSQNIERLNTAIKAFQEAQDVGKQYGEEQVAAKAKNIVPQLYYAKGVYQFKTNDYADALETLNQAIEKDSDLAKVYNQKGLVLKNMSDDSLLVALEQFDKAIQIAEKTNNSKVADAARDNANSNLVYRGAQAIDEEQFDKAVELLQRALNYDEQSEDAHFRLAQAYNKMEQWNKALEHANKGLEFEKGGRTDRAKIYFEKATALKNLERKDQACEAFGNAAYGSFKSPAEHEMKYELECPQAESKASTN